MIIVDGMLGKLAKWLRLLGFDVYYDPYINDEELLRITKEKKGILLTCDEELSYKAYKNEVKVLLLKKGEKVSLLKEVLKYLNVDLKQLNIGSRCMLCNSLLIKVDKENVKDLYQKVLERNSEIFYCEKCKKYYWHGSHWKNIEKDLKKIGIIIN